MLNLSFFRSISDVTMAWKWWYPIMTLLKSQDQDIQSSFPLNYNNFALRFRNIWRESLYDRDIFRNQIDERFIAFVYVCCTYKSKTNYFLCCWFVCTQIKFRFIHFMKAVFTPWKIASIHHNCGRGKRWCYYAAVLQIRWRFQF